MKAKPELPNINIQTPNMSAAETFGQAVEGKAIYISIWRYNIPSCFLGFQTTTTEVLPEQLELFLKHVAKTGDIV